MSFTRCIAAAVIAGTCASVFSIPAVAGLTTGNLSVSASVAQNCTVGDATLAFGAYDPVAANATSPLNATATLILTCTKGATGITLGLGNSANAPAGCNAPARCLASSGNYLNYQLYSDSGRASAWTTAIAETVSGGIASPTSVTVYAQIPAGQDASVGASYSDTVVATINF